MYIMLLNNLFMYLSAKETVYKLTIYSEIISLLRMFGMFIIPAALTTVTMYLNTHGVDIDLNIDAFSLYNAFTGIKVPVDVVKNMSAFISGQPHMAR